jgi:hypothetical protein
MRTSQTEFKSIVVDAHVQSYSGARGAMVPLDEDAVLGAALW